MIIEVSLGIMSESRVVIEEKEASQYCVSFEVTNCDLN